MKDGQPTLGARLRRLRIAKGLTQREVAAPQYTHAYISTIEAGRRHPSPAALAHFAKQLGIEVDDLVSGRPPGLARQLDEQLAAARLTASEGRLEEAEAMVASAERRARRHGLRRVQAASEEVKAVMLERAGKAEAALECYERAEELLEHEAPQDRVGAVAGKARCLQYIGDVRYPIVLLESLERSLPSGGDAEALAQVRAGLLSAYVDAGLLQAADDVARELERVLPRVLGDARRGQGYLYLAALRESQGRSKESQRLLAAGAEAFASSGLRTETGYAHLMRGIFESRHGKFGTAERELGRAREVFEETRNQKELCNTLIELARVERLRGRVDECIALLDDVIARLDASHAELLAWAHREYGLLFEGRDAALSEKHLRQALDLFERGDAAAETAATYRMLGDVLRADGQEEAAFDAYAAGIERLPAPD